MDAPLDLYSSRSIKLIISKRTKMKEATVMTFYRKLVIFSCDILADCFR
jgi:hypothetical protein